VKGVVFDVDEHLKEHRARERQNSHQLLWENVQESHWWPPYSSMTENEVDEEKIEIQFCHYHAAAAQFFIAFSGTIERLENDGIRNILLYGAARRAGSIFRSIKELLSVAPLGRTSPLTRDELTIVNDCLMLLYVHYIGVIDAFSIAYAMVIPSLNAVPEKSADLLTKKFRTKIGNSRLDKIFSKNDLWLSTVRTHKSA
jgi:hypothetical protein